MIGRALFRLQLPTLHLVCGGPFTAQQFVGVVDSTGPQAARRRKSKTGIAVVMELEFFTRHFRDGIDPWLS